MPTGGFPSLGFSSGPAVSHAYGAPVTVEGLTVNRSASLLQVSAAFAAGALLMWAYMR